MSKDKTKQPRVRMARSGDSYYPKDVRPFNLEQALKGAPVMTRLGRRVFEITTIPNTIDYPVFGCMSYGGETVTDEWSLAGYFGHSLGEDDRDLLMAPVAYIKNKPVFVGDGLLYIRYAMDLYAYDVKSAKSFETDIVLNPDIKIYRYTEKNKVKLEALCKAANVANKES
jgi:hypothetical protein